MYDSDIRAALRRRVEQRFRDQPHLLVPEVDLRWGIPVRIDEMLVADKIWGFEIKSNRDSVSRFARQIQGYNPFVQRACLVVGNRLMARATEMLPEWWGILSASADVDGNVRLKRVRQARSNPEFDPIMLTTHMSRADLSRELRAAGVSKLSSHTVDELRFILFNKLGPTKTVRSAMNTMRNRTDWIARAQQSQQALPAAV